MGGGKGTSTQRRCTLIKPFLRPPSTETRLEIHRGHEFLQLLTLLTLAGVATCFGQKNEVELIIDPGPSKIRSEWSFAP